MYPLLTLDSNGELFDGARKHRLTFAKGALPPADAFWSVTMYSLRQSLLLENPIDRHLIDSPMLRDMTLDDDGGLTIHIQHESPGDDLEANRLPAPAGGFWTPIRMCWPKEEGPNGDWKAPSVWRVAD